jgi:hypothetical protein
MQEGLVRELHPIATIFLSGIGFYDFCKVVIALECKPSDLNESFSARLLFYFIDIPKKRRLLRGANVWARATVCFGCCLRLGFGGASTIPLSGRLVGESVVVETSCLGLGFGGVVKTNPTC